MRQSCQNFGLHKHLPFILLYLKYCTFFFWNTLNAWPKRGAVNRYLSACLRAPQAQFQASRPYRVLDAKLVSSCLSWPSRASPHLSLLSARRGVNMNTLLSVKPGPTGHPSLTVEHTISMNINALLCAITRGSKYLARLITYTLCVNVD